MSTKRFVSGFVIAIGLFASGPLGVAAQNPEQGDVSASGQVRVSTPHRSNIGGVRLALQGRLDAMNIVQMSRPAGFGLQQDLGTALMTPLATPGVRILNGSLFLGLGVGFAGVSADTAPDTEESRAGFSLVPTASYDLVLQPGAALSVGGMLTLASLGESEECDPDCTSQNDDAFGIGLTGLVGLRGMITEAISIGTEFGWGFLSISADPFGDSFIHSVLGMIVFEASVGL